MTAGAASQASSLSHGGGQRATSGRSGGCRGPRRRQVQPAFPRSGVGDVRAPEAVGYVGSKSRSTRSGAVLTPWTRIVVLPRRRLACPARLASRISRSTRLRPTRMSCSSSSSRVHPRRSVGLLRLLVDASNQLGQRRVLARAPRRLAALPGVKARPADAQHPAHRRDRVLGLLRGDEREHAAESCFPRQRRPPLFSRSPASR